MKVRWSNDVENIARIYKRVSVSVNVEIVVENTKKKKSNGNVKPNHSHDFVFFLNKKIYILYN